jgi:hypothetical protein
VSSPSLRPPNPLLHRNRRWSRGINVARGALLFVAWGTACTIGPTEDAETPADGSLGASCDSDEDCTGDRVCPRGGHLAGHCAATCTGDADCRIAAGDAYYCLDAVCTRLCRDRCSLGAVVSTCAAEEQCVTQDRLETGATDCLAWCVP